MSDKHGKQCQCGTCVERRFAEYQDRVDSYLKQGIIPRNPEQTVMVKEFRVRSHFRRNPRHMTKDEGLRHAVDSYLNKLFTKGGTIRGKVIDIATASTTGRRKRAV